MLALSLGLAGIFFDNGLGIVLKLAGIVGIIAVGLRVVTDSDK